MIPLSPTLKAILGSIVIGGAAGFGFLEHVEPMWQWVPSVVGVLTGLELFFTQPGGKS